MNTREDELQMKSVGLISEYNPFHNGHLYHAQQSKIQSDAEIAIAIMSGNFVMRGEPAIYNKFYVLRWLYQVLI